MLAPSTLASRGAVEAPSTAPELSPPPEAAHPVEYRMPMMKYGNAGGRDASSSERQTRIIAEHHRLARIRRASDPSPHRHGCVPVARETRSSCDLAALVPGFDSKGADLTRLRKALESLRVDEELALSALKLERSAFVANLPRWFLIVPVEKAAKPSVRFRTVATAYVNELAAIARRPAESEIPSLRSPRWNRQAWTPAQLVKRKGSPYSDRISIGRAPNVDLVIQSRFVSKLHAHIELSKDQSLVVTDLDSQNGTFINGDRLAPRSRIPISNGDILSLGEVHCEIATCDVVYYALRRKYLLLLGSTKEAVVTTADDGARRKRGA
jgi:hypothetical protein